MVSSRPWHHQQTVHEGDPEYLCMKVTLNLCACSVFDHWEQMTYDPLKVHVVA